MTPETKMVSEATRLLESVDGPANDQEDSALTNRRGGGWMNQEQVGIAADNPERTAQFYRNARNADTIYDEEKWLARVFNNKEWSEKIASAFFQKEMRSDTVGYDNIADIAQEIKGDLQYMTDQADGKSKKNRELYIRWDTRTPEDIIEVDQVIQLLFKEIEKKWPSRPLNKMVLTYAIVKARLDHHLHSDIPMYDELMRLIDTIEAQGKDWETRYVFLGASGISQHTYESVVWYLIKEAEKYGVDSTIFK